LLDMEKVKLDGEQLLGLDDQLKALQQSDPYLFGDAEEWEAAQTRQVPGTLK